MKPNMKNVTKITLIETTDYVEFEIRYTVKYQLNNGETIYDTVSTFGIEEVREAERFGGALLGTLKAKHYNHTIEHVHTEIMEVDKEC